MCKLCGASIAVGDVFHSDCLRDLLRATCEDRCLYRSVNPDGKSCRTCELNRVFHLYEEGASC